MNGWDLTLRIDDDLLYMYHLSEMTVSKDESKTPWLLLTFTLPVKRASQRVAVWRKLQRYGAIPLGNSGYLLPNDPTNQERFEWIAAAIRKYAGEASVVHVQSIDNLSAPQLVARFAEARAREYRELGRELQEVSSTPPQDRTIRRLSRIKSRFREIVEIDFFRSPLQKRVEAQIAGLDASRSAPGTKQDARVSPKEYRGRLWVTRPRPGIDRSASAWLIRRSIDPKARFAFAEEAHVPRKAVPFDMDHP